jgi:hypothetical protein
MKLVKITKEHFMSYYRVQQSGEFNMLSQEARHLTGLTEEYYFEIMNNYDMWYGGYEGAVMEWMREKAINKKRFSS